MFDQLPSPEKGSTYRVVIEFDEKRYKLLFEILWYLKGIHHHIDEDMFDIPLDVLEAMHEAFTHEDVDPEDFRLSVNWYELGLLQMMIDAADAYSHRKTESPVPGVDDDEFEPLRDWLYAHESALFREPANRRH